MACETFSKRKLEEAINTAFPSVSYKTTYTFLSIYRILSFLQGLECQTEKTLTTARVLLPQVTVKSMGSFLSGLRKETAPSRVVLLLCRASASAWNPMNWIWGDGRLYFSTENLQQPESLEAIYKVSDLSQAVLSKWPIQKVNVPWSTETEKIMNHGPHKTFW